ncbi:type II secretion system protein [bacterium]|nr:type II secretion system protein [bacterium]
MGKSTIKIKHAFTLAETLITIGIIGVVSALTIPNLRQNYYEKQTTKKLISTYSILTQAIRMAENEYGDVTGWGVDSLTKQSARKIMEMISPFLKISLDCGTNDNSGKCLYNGEYLLLNNESAGNYATQEVYYKISLNNGSTIWWRGGANQGEYIFFFIDTNGKYKPNKWGWDLFGFQYIENIGLIPAGNPQGIMSDFNCINGTSKGYGCAYYVLQNENMNYLH